MLEKLEQIITNFLICDFEYVTDKGLLKNECGTIKKSPNHESSKYHYNILFPNLHYKYSKDHWFYKKDIAPNVYLIAYHAEGQFKLDLYYHGVSLNLYRYYNSTTFAGFMELEFFKTIDLNDFVPCDRRECMHHEYRMVCSYEAGNPKFLQLGITNDTLVINTTYMHELLGGDWRFRASFDKDIFEKIGIKHIVFQKYTYSFTDLFNIPSTLESVSFDLIIDDYHSITSQKNRIFSQEPKLIPYIKDKKLQEEAKQFRIKAENEISYNTPVFLNYNSNKGTVFTNLLAYNQFKSDFKGHQILKEISIINVKTSKARESIIQFLPAKIGDTSWWDTKYDKLRP